MLMKQFPHSIPLWQLQEVNAKETPYHSQLSCDAYNTAYWEVLLVTTSLTKVICFKKLEAHILIGSITSNTVHLLH